MPAVLPPSALEELLPRVEETVRQAGALALDWAARGARRWTKNDASFVTEADIAVDRFLHEHLRALLPEAAWLSEETADTPERLDARTVWVVDPIDGTRAFMEGDPVWVIAVALVRQGRPVLGVIYNPTRDEMFSAQEGRGARLNGAALQAQSRESLQGASMSGPRPMMEELLGEGVARSPWIYALAYRLVNVADNRLDAALSKGNAKDWDIAAADLILHEAGAHLTGIDGATPLYNQPLPVHGPLIAASEPLLGILRLKLASHAMPPNP